MKDLSLHLQIQSFTEIHLKVTSWIIVPHYELTLVSRVCFFPLNCGKGQFFNVGNKTKPLKGHPG